MHMHMHMHVASPRMPRSGVPPPRAAEPHGDVTPPPFAQVAIGIGDLGLAYQAFKIAISEDSNHAEAYTNLGVLELRKGNIDAARSNFSTAHTLAPHMFEPCFRMVKVASWPRHGRPPRAFQAASEGLGRLSALRRSGPSPQIASRGRSPGATPDQTRRLRRV